MYTLIVVLMLGLMHPALAQECIVFVQNPHRTAYPISLIDSITAPEKFLFLIFSKGQPTPLVVPATTALFHTALPDTLLLDYHENWVSVSNPHLESIDVQRQGTEITVQSHTHQPFVCLVKGTCSNGRLIMDADTTCTLIFSDLHLASKEGSAIYLKQKQKTEILLAEGTTSTLSDAFQYNLPDTTDSSNACIYAKGSITFSGTGSLNVKGNYRHAIASSKNVTVEGGHIKIADTRKDGIHCDKYKQKGGTVTINLSHVATKGIKTKKGVELTGGRIEGEAVADLKIADSETSYCTLIKSDSLFTMDGGDIELRHRGRGGRCISVDNDFKMTAGKMALSCHGDGGSYLTASNELDFYTPKCITVDGSMHIERGQLHLLATGAGGKGINCSETLFIGRKGDGFLADDSLLICIETLGSALVDNLVEDYRRGCPKALKCNGDAYFYSGTLRLRTHGQGGEGIESKGSLRAYNTTILADCHDDGINTGLRCYIDGSHIFCRSTANDGIDSNGKMTVMDGIVAAISEDPLNECFDTEDQCLYLYGGSIVGFGNNEVLVGGQTNIPYYNTRLRESEWGRRYGDGITLGEGRYLTISKGEEAILSLYHETQNEDAFIIVASPSLEPSETYNVSDGARPSSPIAEWFDGRLLVGGRLSTWKSLFNFKTY